MDKQMIEEMARTFGGCHITPNCKVCCAYSGSTDCPNKTSAQKLYNAGYRKIPEGAVVLTGEEYERLTEELAKYIQKAWFFYKRCKSYGIENFYDEDLEGQFKPATEGNTIAFGKFKWVEKQDGVEE